SGGNRRGIGHLYHEKNYGTLEERGLVRNASGKPARPVGRACPQTVGRGPSAEGHSRRRYECARPRHDRGGIGQLRGSRLGPDPPVVRGYGQRVLLERGDPSEIEIAAVKFFDIVAARRKPKWDRYLIVGRVDCDEGVLRALVSGKQEQPEALVSVP